MKASLLIFAAIGAEACQRERTFRNHNHRHAKRQASTPVPLDEYEQILVDSFDATSIATWSYYYSLSIFDRDGEIG
jgi:N-acetylated-alpha-linked acidic dipeptidase